MNQNAGEQTFLYLYRTLFILPGLFGVAALYALSQSNYLLYHSLIELTAVGVAISMFTVGWNTRRYASSDSLFLLGTAYASVALLDLVHTLAYKGIGVFPERGADLPTQLWVAARFVESVSLLAAAMLVNRRKRLPEWLVLAVYVAATAALVALILPLRWFPAMYVPGEGLTASKIATEYVLCGMLGLSLAVFWRQRAHFSRHDLGFLLAAVALSIAAELSFTLYTDVYGLFNFLGHLLKLASFICIYQALVSGLLRQPYESLFRELVNSRDKLDKLVELNADGIMVIDRQGVILFCNPAVAKMLSRTESELLGEQFGYPLTPGKSTEIELLSGNGEVLVAELRTSETQWSGSSALLASFRDITDRKLAERELWEREQELETIYQNAPLMLMLVDSDRKIRKANASTSDFSGMSSKETYGKRAGEVLHCLHHLDDPRGCGFGPNCGQCTVRNTVIDTFKTGSSHDQVEASLTMMSQEGEREVTFLLSTSLLRHKDEELVLVAITDITERKEAEKSLSYASFHDFLTGLYNRNFFETEMFRFSDGRYTPMGVIVCDLDGLKFINDSLGHQSGDELLKNTADILRNTFRSSDIMARIGGDEFAVLIPQTDQDIAETLAQRLRDSVEEYNKQDTGIPLSLSIGFAVSGQGPVDMQKPFREADNRMYREKVQRKGSGHNAAVQALTQALEARDFLTEGHSERLQNLVVSLARSTGMPEDEINDLLLLAQFHDLGKVGIPDRILFKPGPLTEEEWQEMRQHSEIGQRIAQSVPDLAPIAEWILKHHERWDGGGYPQGLKGEKIPLPCRILAIADSYDAMISDRPYRKGMSQEEAIAELRRCAGTQFDPNLVERFIKIMRETDNAKS